MSSGRNATSCKQKLTRAKLKQSLPGKIPNVSVNSDYVTIEEHRIGSLCTRKSISIEHEPIEFYVGIDELCCLLGGGGGVSDFELFSFMGTLT